MCVFMIILEILHTFIRRENNTDSTILLHVVQTEFPVKYLIADFGDFPIFHYL